MHDGTLKHYMVDSYKVAWEGKDSKILVINDISEEKAQIKELESHAFWDEMTGLHSRFYGMEALNDWIEKKIGFSLVFFDLDNLKYINDTYGHDAGDKFIFAAASHFDVFPEGTLGSRIGGDELMLLVPIEDNNLVHSYISTYLDALRNDHNLDGKTYSYEASFGVVSGEETSRMKAGAILQMADERMYENKRARKKTRNTQ